MFRRPSGTAATGRCQPGADRAGADGAASRARGVRAAVVRAGVPLTAAPRSGRVFAAGSGQPAARSALARGLSLLPSALARPAAGLDAGAHAVVTPALRRAPQRRRPRRWRIRLARARRRRCPTGRRPCGPSPRPRRATWRGTPTDSRSPAATSSMSWRFSAVVSVMMLSSNVTRTSPSSGSPTPSLRSAASSARQIPDDRALERALVAADVPHQRRVVRRHLRGRLHVPDVLQVEVVDAEPAEVPERLQRDPERPRLRLRAQGRRELVDRVLGAT